MSDDPSCTALVPFFGQGSESAQTWMHMHRVQRFPLSP